MLYPKVYNLFMQHVDGELRGKMDESRPTRPEFKLLWDLPWSWMEKINGMNVRVIWDGHKVGFGGRTDDAIFPMTLFKYLEDTFTEEIMEQQFHDSPAILFGEGWGYNIAKGSGLYGSIGFSLFDVRVGDWWLLPDKVREVSMQIGIETAPMKGEANIGRAIELVRGGMKSRFGDFTAEGLVGKPPLGITARDGDRLLVKIKTVHFRE